MTKLVYLLTIIFIVFTMICLLFCIEAYFRYKSKRGIDEDKDFTNKYQYFVQTIYDEDDQLAGYELLLREFNPQTGRWQLPRGVNYFPLNMVAEAVEKQQDQFKGQIRFIAINMMVSQLVDYRAENFFNWVLGVLPQKNIVLELDNEDVLNSNWFQRRHLMWDLKRIASEYPTVRVSIEDVDSSENSYRKLTWLLPWIDYVKFNADTFNKSEQHWIEVTLAQWQRKLEEYDVKVALGKIENESQDALAKQLNVNLREGYFYQKPHQLK